MIGDTGRLVNVSKPGDTMRRIEYDPPVTLSMGESLINDYETMTYRVVASGDGLVHVPFEIISSGLVNNRTALPTARTHLTPEEVERVHAYLREKYRDR